MPSRKSLSSGWPVFLEVPLHIGLGRGDAVDLRVIEDERQVLPLFRGIRLARHCRPIVQDPCEDRQRTPAVPSSFGRRRGHFKRGLTKSKRFPVKPFIYMTEMATGWAI